jgi:hypothetical protein
MAAGAKRLAVANDKKNQALIARFVVWAQQNRIRRSRTLYREFMKVPVWKIGFIRKWEDGGFFESGVSMPDIVRDIPVYVDRRGRCFCDGKRLKFLSEVNDIQNTIARHVARNGVPWR